ncbi:undecaprenyl-diphosphatase [Roseateles sp.]|uniref:undecaprenyl-diphosphatase n=1 Tax=Roseateles sp. TaxID=1971397 RepID=UPI0025E4AE4A|nr:undecaprenyl-diphosphatase [Roseateles sp.]MBV8034301.1 undecaprenyl-diphosphatase [Roseateles sp.]
MEALNHTVFLWLNAPEQPNALAEVLAIFLAEYLIWAVPALIGLGWLRGDERTRKAMLVATAAALLGLLVNQLIGLAWDHPRPFVIGLGHTLIPHVADSSFPSDHLTLWWAVAFSLLLQRTPRGLGAWLVPLGLPIAWARIYLGVHYPLDMLGAALMGLSSAWLSLRAAQGYLPPVYRLASHIHRALFSRLIARGWVRD